MTYIDKDKLITEIKSVGFNKAVEQSLIFRINQLATFDLAGKISKIKEMKSAMKGAQLSFATFANNKTATETAKILEAISELLNNVVELLEGK